MKRFVGSRWLITRCWRGLFFLGALILGAPFSLASSSSAGPAEIVIVHTNNVTGHLFGCPT